MIDPELQKMLERQSERLGNMEMQLKKIQRHLLWENIGSWLRIALILVPLIVGYIYLSPLLQKTLTQYQQLLNPSNTSQQFNN